MTMLTCSLQVPELCGLPAVEAVIVQQHGGTATAHLRCEPHRGTVATDLIPRVVPDAKTATVRFPPGIGH